jgi:hypothetical protein
MRGLAFIVVLGVAAGAAAQETGPSIDPGMSRAQVIERLGRPVSERSDGAYTFLYYRNGCEKTCGMHDVVMLEHDAVVDAIFRSPARHYTGQSSSPEQVPPARARRARAGAAPGGRGAAPAAERTPGPPASRPAGLPATVLDSLHRPDSLSRINAVHRSDSTHHLDSTHHPDSTRLSDSTHHQ